jgi:DNA-binding winged helix-turn-helix (wHTH) protein
MSSSSRFHFGGVTFDVASGDLTRGGARTRLQPQVAALLLVLLENAGSVVTRSDLQARLWPDTTVEFDEGINFCVRQLRVALGDDSSAPRFIETLPKRGYRFLAPVTADTAAGEASPREPAPPAPTAAAGETVTRSRAMAPILLSAAALALAAGLTALARGRWLARDATPARDPVILEILPFAADTTDSMAVAYRRRLTSQILADARTEHGWKTVTETSPGTTHVLSGSLTRHGNSVQIFAELVLAGTRQHVWADDITDSYAFSGNSAVTAGRIEQSVARVLGIRR